MYLIYKRQEDLRAFLSFSINVIDCVAFFDCIFREGVGGKKIFFTKYVCNLSLKCVVCLLWENSQAYFEVIAKRRWSLDTVGFSTGLTVCGVKILK